MPLGILGATILHDLIHKMSLKGSKTHDAFNQALQDALLRRGLLRGVKPAYTIEPQWPPGTPGQKMHIQFISHYDELTYMLDQSGHPAWFVTGTFAGESPQPELLIELYEGYTMVFT